MLLLWQKIGPQFLYTVTELNQSWDFTMLYRPTTTVVQYCLTLESKSHTATEAKCSSTTTTTSSDRYRGGLFHCRHCLIIGQTRILFGRSLFSNQAYPGSCNTILVDDNEDPLAEQLESQSRTFTSEYGQRLLVAFFADSKHN